MVQFKDREDAGKRLAAQLKRYQKDHVVVFALPRGGVPLGRIIADELDTPLDLLIPRKVGHPNNPELAECAVTEDGHVFCDQSSIAGIDEEWLNEEISIQQQEAKRRRLEYLSGREPVAVKDKTAIIVDDGVATGLTMHAAIAQLKDKAPAKVVMAVPVIPNDVAERFAREVDDVVAVDAPAVYRGSVGAYYQTFDQTSDEEVKELMGVS